MKAPSFDLTNKVALITGGSKGIGYGMAHELGSYGAHVIIASRGQDEGRKAQEELADAGIKATYIQADVTNKESVDRLVKTVVDEFRSIHILVNNHGKRHQPRLHQDTHDRRLAIRPGPLQPYCEQHDAEESGGTF